MGGKGSGKAVPIVVGDRIGQLTVVEELEADPHYGKRARYRCSCGVTIERDCWQVRLQRKRVEERARTRGVVPWGPSCNGCTPKVRAA